MESGVPSGLGGAVERLAAELGRQEAGLAALQSELGAARSALAEVAAWRPASRSDAIVGTDAVAQIVARLIRHCDPMIRSMVRTINAQPEAAAVVSQMIAERGRQHVDLRAIYPIAAIGTERARAHIQRWGDLGEQQRLLPEVRSEFWVFGADAVVSLLSWAHPESGYIVIRDPLDVAAFTAVFDLSWDRALPVGGRELSGEDSHLIDLLMIGVKDEGIARYLGIGVRTVRRRIAALMALYNVESRFQLGAAVTRSRETGKVR